MMPDTATQRRDLADRLQKTGVLTHPRWRAAVEAVPRELFLQPGVFLPTDGGHWRPVTALGTDPKEWSKIAYRDESLVTQLDGHLTADQAAAPVPGVPTSSSTTPVTVVGMIEALDIEGRHTTLEIGTGTGYSTGRYTASPTPGYARPSRTAPSSPPSRPAHGRTAPASPR